MKVKKFDTMNVVPFIDIMLVLLVIVLTTASFVAKGIIPLDISKAKSTQELKKQKNVIISINKKSELFLNEIKITKEDFLSKLLSFDKNSIVIINCDKTVAFGDFVFIIDILKNNSFKNLGIMTKYE